MDCEKFESTMIDELYEELDELTSAAAKRHVAGCARCASLFGGLRATRRVAVLPLVAAPDGLEDRILAAARQAQKVIPFRGRVARAVSTAGTWAMRPQTAMAALFLLMIGSSVLFLRTRQAKAPASSTVTVSQLGAPSPAASMAVPADLPYQAPAEKKGGDVAATTGRSDLASNGPRSEATALDGLAKDDRRAAPRGLEAEAAEHGRAIARSASQPSWAYNNNGLPPSADNAAPVPYAAPPPPMAAGAPAQEAQAQTATTNPTLNAAMAAYNAQQYGDAYRMFSALAANDLNAALYAARSLRSVSGCSAAAPRFDDVAQRGAGTKTGWDATLEGGRCYEVIGAFDMARDHMRSLLTVPGYAQAAQRELDVIDRASASAARAKAAAPPAATATATAAPNASASAAPSTDRGL